MQNGPHRDCIGDYPSPSTSAPQDLNWVPNDRAQTLALRRERDVINDIRNDKQVAAATDICRQVLKEYGRDTIAPPEMQRRRQGGEPEQLSYYGLARSKNLAAAIFPTQAPAGTPRSGLSGHATGLFVYDLDQDVTDVEGVRAACIAWPHTRIVATSVSAEGLWLVLRGPVATTRAEYSAAHKALFLLIPEPIRRHIAEHQANLDRLRYVSNDPDIFYNPDAPAVPGEAVPVTAGPDQTEGGREAREKRPKGWPVKASTAREKARKILQKVKLPEDSHGTWIANAFSLVDGDRIYGTDFDGRGIFVEWTKSAAHAGSTKPTRADDQYTKATAADWATGPRARRRSLASLGRGDGKQASQSQRHQEERDAASDAANSWIDGWVEGESVIWWRRRFRRKGSKESCVWQPESEQFFRQDFQRFQGEFLGDPRRHLVRTDQRASAIESLKDAVSPPVISELLLNRVDYLKNYDLQTGQFLQTTAFENGAVELDAAAPYGFRLVTPAHWHFHNTFRPHRLPQDRPPEPERFNEFLHYRWPDRLTQLAIRQLVGATLLQRLPDENRLVFLQGPGGSGKGTLVRVLVALIGNTYVFTVPNVARLVSSPFAISQLDEAALVLVSDPPDTSTRLNRTAVSDGLTIIRNLTGQDDVPIERKGQDQYSARANASVWINSNFPITDWVTGDADRDSWKRRIVAIPCKVQLPEDEQRADYEKRFVSEYPSVAWHCIAAYAEMYHSQAGYSASQEMLGLKAKQVGGHLANIQEFAAALQLSPDVWTSRTDLRKAYCRKVDVPKIAKPVAMDLYKAVGALPNVFATRHNSGEGFLGVALPGTAKRAS